MESLGKLTPLRVVFGIDLRTLALFRVLLGFYLLLATLLRMADLSAHYTDAGVMPRDVQLDMLASGSWSLHLFNGTFTAQAVLFVITNVCVCVCVCVCVHVRVVWKRGMLDAHVKSSQHV